MNQPDKYRKLACTLIDKYCRRQGLLEDLITDALTESAREAMAQAAEIADDYQLRMNGIGDECGRKFIKKGETMTFKDSFGRVVSEGDLVVLPLGLGNNAVATILKLSSGLGLQSTQAQPSAVVQVTILLPVDQSGALPVIKDVELKQPEKVLEG
jgi:hypothetical protein